MGKKGIRVCIQFFKQDGKPSEFWTDAPEGWDRMGAGDRDAWVSRTAFKRHKGAQRAAVVKRGK